MMNKKRLVLVAFLAMFAIAICMGSVKADSTEITWNDAEGNVNVSYIDDTISGNDFTAVSKSTGSVTYTFGDNLFAYEKEITIDDGGLIMSWGSRQSDVGNIDVDYWSGLSEGLFLYPPGEYVLAGPAYFKQYHSNSPGAAGMTWYMQGSEMYQFAVRDNGTTGTGGNWSFWLLENGVGSGELWIGSNDRGDVTDLNSQYTGFTASIGSSQCGVSNLGMYASTQNLLDYNYVVVDDGAPKNPFGRVEGGATLVESTSSLGSLSLSGDIQEF